jgi:hypothetical protein
MLVVRTVITVQSHLPSNSPPAKLGRKPCWASSLLPAASVAMNYVEGEGCINSFPSTGETVIENKIPPPHPHQGGVQPASETVTAVLLPMTAVNKEKSWLYCSNNLAAMCDFSDDRADGTLVVWTLSQYNHTCPATLLQLNWAKSYVGQALYVFRPLWL